MKRFLVGTAVAASMFSAAYALPVDNFYMKDSVLYVEGSGEKGEKASLVLTEKNETKTGTYDFVDRFGNGHIEMKKADKDGKYIFAVPVASSSQTYTLKVVLDGQTAEKTFAHLASADEKNNFCTALAAKSESEIAAELEKYALTLELGCEKGEGYYKMLAQEVKKSDIATLGFSALSQLSQNVDKKEEFLRKLEQTVVSSQIGALVSQYNDVLEFDLTDYNSLKNPYEADEAFIGKSYQTVEDFAEDWRAAVSAQKADEANQTTQRPSSGGGGGGGAGGSVSLKPVVSQTDNSQSSAEENKKPDASGFCDMTGFEWASESVAALKQRGAINGVDSQNYNPSGNITREEFAKIICAAFGFEASGEAEFEDVEPGAWYSPYVAELAKQGIIMGQGTKFGVGESITREDAAVILERLDQNGVLSDSDELLFDDSGEISDYAKAAVAKLCKSGVINGKENNKFDPKGSLSRAEGAKLVYEMLKRTEAAE